MIGAPPNYRPRLATWSTLFTARVYGTPKGQPRARAFARKLGNGKFTARVYDAGTAEGWKSEIAIALRPFLPAVPLAVPIWLDVVLLFPRPKTMMTRSYPAGRMLHTKKPDRDNADKAVMDCMTALGFWEDDCQVCAGSPIKLYIAKGERPGAEITLKTFEGGDRGEVDTAEILEQPTLWETVA